MIAECSQPDVEVWTLITFRKLKNKVNFKLKKLRPTTQLRFKFYFTMYFIYFNSYAMK